MKLGSFFSLCSSRLSRVFVLFLKSNQIINALGSPGLFPVLLGRSESRDKEVGVPTQVRQYVSMHGVEVIIL